MPSDDLRDQIRLAFPATKFFGPITTCDCEECTHLREELRHRQWDELSVAFLDFTCSPTLLTPEAFAAFLPAYLLRALDDLSANTVVTEFTVYSLCPNQPEEDDQDRDFGSQYKESRLSRQVQFMTPSQIQAIRTFLFFVQEHSGNGDWFRPFISSALEKVWR